MNNAGGLGPPALAHALEERGFGSFWVGEHSHIPVGTPLPYGRRGPLPDSYKGMMDPFVTLAAAAVVTKTLRLGTSVLLPAERDPFHLAKSAASLDQISGGRLTIGVGVGWNRGEYENHSNVPWNRRHELLQERIAAVRALWASEEASFEGAYVKFGPVWSFPKPVQVPHPPLLVGTSGSVGIRHMLAWGDGWAPLIGSFAEFISAHRKVLELAEQVGRDPGSLEIMVSLRGEPDLESLLRFRDFGIRTVRLGGDPAVDESESAVLRRIDRFATFIPEVA